MAMIRQSFVGVNASLRRRLCIPAASAEKEEAAAAGAATAVAPAEDPTISSGTRRLCKKFMNADSAGRSTGDLLQRGHVVGKRGMVRCVAELGKNKRYERGLEILEWMGKRRYKRCSRTRALTIEILWKTKGIAEAGKHFEDFSDEERNRYAYTALLKCYCSEKMADRAIKLFEEMVKLDRLSSLAFNSMRDLAIAIGDPEKALDLADEMRRRNLDFDVEGAEKWIGEIEGDEKRCRSSCCRILALVCIKAGEFEMAVKALKKLEEVSRIHPHCASKSVEI